MRKIIICLNLLMLVGFSNAQHNFDNQNILYSNGAKLGLGTSTPTEKFQIYDDISGSVFLGVYNDNTSSNSIAGIKLGMGIGYDVGTNLYHKKVDNTFYFENLGAPNSKFAFLTRKANGTYGTVLKINEDGNIGIGNTSPKQKLEVYNPTPFNTKMELEGQDHIAISSDDPGNGNYFGGISWRIGSRRRAAIAATREHTDGDYIGLAFFTKGTDGPGPMYESMRITRNGNVGIGTDNPDSKLTVAGGIHAREVRVTVNAGADFVFEEDYNLRPLDELDKFLKENKHLPEIVSAENMELNGIQLADMNIKLLQKIEELTLYTIQQQKEIETLKSFVGNMANSKN